jgi:hypothetical protein
MAAKKTGSGKTGARSASPKKGAGAGSGRGGAGQINKVSKKSAATGRGSTTPPRRGFQRGS